MAEVFLNNFGSGYTTTDALPPMVEGEWFTITFIPDADCELLDVRAFDSHDFAVALPPVQNNEIRMKWRAMWGNLYVDCYYTNSEPPEPAPPYPWWLLIGLKKNNNKEVRKCIT